MAGEPVDTRIESLLPLIDPGDVIVDGGNSNHLDTTRRTHELAERGVLFVGMGISGGEEGARNGPSIMPGGNPSAWPLIRDLFQDIAASADGEPCCDWVGPDGAGHFVKTVHNGIEYGDMQLIAEAYDVMRRGLGMAADEMRPVFARWNEGKLESYLIEITADILAKTDGGGSPLVDKILDVAGHKGTGRWTVEASIDEGIPISLIAEAVYARMVSGLKDERVAASSVLSGPDPLITHDRDQVLVDLHDALYASKIVSYAQGFMLMQAVGAAHGWDLDLGLVAGLWRAGCIIRSHFISDITHAYREQPELANLLLAPFFDREIGATQGGWRRTVAHAAAAGIPIPAYGAALSFFDGYRSGRLPANLIQAQRDYFGAHTYERVDQPRGSFFHTEW
jgi:6-phosphogluconate dehydrogenase